MLGWDDEENMTGSVLWVDDDDDKCDKVEEIGKVQCDERQTILA